MTGWVLPLCWVLAIIFLPIQLIIEPTYISEHTWEFLGYIVFIILPAPFMWELFFPKKEESHSLNLGKLVDKIKNGDHAQQIDAAKRTIKKVGENIPAETIEKLSSDHPELKKGLEKLKQFASRHKS